MSEKNYLPNATYAFAPYNKPVMSQAEAASTLRATGGWVMAKGDIWDLTAVDLGAGMCRMELSRRVYPHERVPSGVGEERPS